MNPKSEYRSLMLGLGWLVYFFFGMVSYSLPVLASVIGSDLKLTDTQIGTVMGAWPLTILRWLLLRVS